ncbi:MAG: hypothetical protein FGM55_15075 [Rhodoferax sp.]|nr:hypothetical protein [Rhodoferax sp.]
MPVGTVQLITQAEYARRRNCTEGAVRRAVRDGRISLIDGKIDPVAADAQWARNTRVRAGSHATDDANLNAGAQRGRGQAEGAEDEGSSYWHSKSRREQAEAELAELRLAELRGILVREEEVRASLSRRVATLRESFLQLPARVVPLLVAEPDASSMHRVLHAEIVNALAQVAEGLDGRA